MIHDYLYRENEDSTYEDSYLQNFLLSRIKNNNKKLGNWKTQKRIISIHFKFFRLSPYYWNKTLMKNLRKLGTIVSRMED